MKAKKLICVLLSVIAVSCIIIPSSAAAAPTLNKTSEYIYLGESIQLSVNNATKSVTWSSSNSTVASVKDGIVSGKKVGTAIIYAKHGTTTLKCSVKVDFGLNTTTHKMKSGQTQTIKLRGASDQSKVVYTSSNDAVVSIAKNGKVTARSGGTVTITAKYNGYTRTFKDVITVDGLVPEVSVSSSNFRYAVFSDEYTWEEAKAACEKMKGHLYVIDSKTKQERIDQIFKDHGNKKYYWVGAKRNVYKDFEWVNDAAFSYTNFAKGQNDNADGIEYYLSLNKDTGKWYDVSKNVAHFGFICEWDS